MSVAKGSEDPDHVLMRNRTRTSLIAASVAAAALAIGAPTASAGLLVASAPDCSAKPTTAAFSKVDGDTTQYWLPPGGGFEAGSPGWSLTGRASVESGNEPWKLAGANDSRSLKLPPGASATSPVVCIGIEHPAVRLVAKSSGLLPTLAVDVITETSLGLKAAVPAGVLLPSGQWKPSPKLIVLSSLLPLFPGDHTPVQFRVTSVGLGTWSVDDFFVDPKCR
jgi:hypothetical protein